MDMSNYYAGATVGVILYILYMVLVMVQTFMGYGTAYRRTKRGGDNGVALFGWVLLFSYAAIVPGLGIYLWNKSKRDEYQFGTFRNYRQPYPPMYPPPSQQYPQQYPPQYLPEQYRQQQYIPEQYPQQYPPEQYPPEQYPPQ